DFNLPKVESKRGTDILKESFGGQGAGFGGSIVFKTDKGVDDPQVRAAMDKLFADFRDIKGVTHVGSPYDKGGARQIATEAPSQRKCASAAAAFDPALHTSDFQDAGKQAGADVDKLDVDGLQVELGGGVFATFENPSSEALGIAFAIFILILAFGSVLAMGL